MNIHDRHAKSKHRCRGHDKELRTLQEVDHVWLVLNTDQSVAQMLQIWGEKCS